MLTAMLCAAAVTAQFVGGKATRDALFLSAVDVTALPAMLLATSITSIVLVALTATAARRIAPATLVPAYFGVSSVLFLAEWLPRVSNVHKPLSIVVSRGNPHKYHHRRFFTSVAKPFNLPI